MNHPTLLGLGTALPEHVMTQQQASEMAADLCELDSRQQRVLATLYRKSGVSQRRTSLPHRIAYEWQQTAAELDTIASSAGPSTQARMKLYEQLAPGLALEAAQAALHQAHLPADEITHLVTVSCTGFSAPGVDISLMQSLDLPPITQRVHVGFMGCHGVLNGLRVCQGLAAVDPQAKILLCAVELCCLHYRMQWDPERFLGNLLFADGAAAAVLGQLPSDANGPNEHRLRVAATGSCLIPESTDAMSWRIGDHGFEMTLSASVPDLIRANLRAWLVEWLHQQGLSLEEIGFWAVHPGGPRILTAVQQSLGLPAEALAVSREVLDQRGNMSSPTVLFILEEHRRRSARGPGLMLGFGPGLMAEAALLD